MPNGTYGGVRGRKTKVGRKLLRFPPTRLFLKTEKFQNISRIKIYRTAIKSDRFCPTLHSIPQNKTTEDMKTIFTHALLLIESITNEPMEIMFPKRGDSTEN